MLRNLRNYLKLFIFAMLGSLVGRSLFVYLDYRKHPKSYAMRSAPWYTEILAMALVSGVIVLIAWITYILIGRKLRKAETIPDDDLTIEKDPL